MSIQSVKARIIGTYLILLILFIIQIPIVYISVSSMGERYAQINIAGSLRKRAIEIAAILDRHIMTGDEALEALFQKRKAEYLQTIDAFKTGNDKISKVTDTKILQKLNLVEASWAQLKTELDKEMDFGDEMRLNKAEVEKSTAPIILKLNVLLQAINQSKAPNLVALIDLTGSQRMLSVQQSYTLERFIISFSEKETLKKLLQGNIDQFDSSMMRLKSAIATARVSTKSRVSLETALNDIMEIWSVRKTALLAAFKSNDSYQTQMLAIINTFTPNLLKADNEFIQTVVTNASLAAKRTITIMVISVLVSVFFSILFMWMTSALVVKPLILLKEMVERFADGDLTGRANIKITMLGKELKDEIYTLGRSIDTMAENVSQVIGRIGESSDHLASASEQLSSSATQIASGTEEQESRASHVATASQEMSATVIEVAKNASGAATAAENANASSINGGDIVKKTIESMNGIAVTAKESSEVIGSLGSRSQEIGKIIKVIEDIADQTNLLALNAAIEAARAGEQGRGFAVVADEVRKLAERTGNATKEIGEMIGSMQSETEKAITTMNKEVKVVEEGVTLAQEAGASLQEISGQVLEVTTVIQQIATAAEEQATTADQISTDIEGVASVTKETAGGVKQIVLASQEMASLAMNLQEMVSMFKVSSSASTPTTYSAPDTQQIAPVNQLKVVG